MPTATFLIPNITRIDLFRDQVPLGHATGFFLKSGDIWHLVSNWHVFSGRNCETGQPVNANGAVPNRCEFCTLQIIGNSITHESHSFRLSQDDDDSALWFEHPDDGQDVDVGCLPLGNFNPVFMRDFLDPTGHDSTMWVDLGGDLFLPGYPLGIEAPFKMAIWKRASLATSTEFGYGVAKHVLVDTATREGMSGAPCLAIANWQYYSLDRQTGKMTLVNEPLRWRLLGVYSGRRMVDGDAGAQLGIVWRENLIFEAMQGGKFASFLLKS